MAYRIFQMRANNLTLRKNRGLSTKCATCGEEIQLEEYVVSKTSGKLRRGLRHESCARRVGIIG